MIDCSKCPFLLRYLSLPNAKYGGRHWTYICSKRLWRNKNYNLHSLIRKKCKYFGGIEQKQLILVLGSDDYEEEI